MRLDLQEKLVVLDALLELVVRVQERKMMVRRRSGPL
jgi:hypothetical protein